MSARLLWFLPLLAGCPDETEDSKDTSETGDSAGPDDSGDTADSGDTGDTGDTGSLEQPLPETHEDTTGPALPECTPASGDNDTVALVGIVLLPAGAVAGAVVYQPSSGEISCAGESCDTAGATVVCTEGIISAGLVDPHNHLQYNTLPPWQVDPEFDDRYDWQGDGRYDDYRAAYDAIEDDYGCEIMKWAEAREIVHGTTSAVGSSGTDDCIARGVRNLDEGESASHLSGYEMDYNSGNVEDNIEEGDGEDHADDLSSGALQAEINHVAEGRDGNVRSEVDHMIDMGMTGPGQVYVHATDASTEQLAVMGGTGTAILWSPRSNVELYATTTPVEVAERFGVPWAIGTDWTPSGSIGQPQELACAEAWLAGKGAPLGDSELYEKVTSEAARVVGADALLGTLETGLKADIAVFDYSSTPYRAIIGAREDTVKLVIVDGEAVYGESSFIETLAEHADWCDTLDACGEERRYCLKDSGSEDSLVDVENTLSAALAEETMPSGYEYAGQLYGLFSCADEWQQCQLGEVSADDSDGDGVLDSTDNCTWFYNPDQLDSDIDSLGDSCDTCPLEPGVDCSFDASDYDGDGVANDSDNCSTVSNADQADADGDGYGDACDECPGWAPDDGAVEATIMDVRSGGACDGMLVTVTGVVTAVVPEGGFFIQDETATEYAGLYVYDQGENSVNTGDALTVTGTYQDYYGLTEISFPESVESTGDSGTITPITLDACAVAANAEAYESMRVTLPGATVTDLNADAEDGSDSPDYDEFVVDDCLRVDDFIDAEIDQPTSMVSYSSIDGILIYTYDNYKLAPLTAASLVEE